MGKREAHGWSQSCCASGHGCEAELRHLSCKRVTQPGFASRICCWRSTGAHLPSAALTLQNTLAGGHGIGEGFYGASPMLPFPCTCYGHSGQGLGSPQGWKSGSARAPLHTRLVSTLKQEVRACSRTSGPDTHKHLGSRQGSILGALALRKGKEIDLPHGGTKEKPEPVASW